jgi:hypothetical protein
LAVNWLTDIEAVEKLPKSPQLRLSIMNEMARVTSNVWTNRLFDFSKETPASLLAGEGGLWCRGLLVSELIGAPGTQRIATASAGVLSNPAHT